MPTPVTPERREEIASERSTFTTGDTAAEVERVLVLSTAHLSGPTALDDMQRDARCTWDIPRVSAHEYGWLVFFGGQPEDGGAEDFVGPVPSELLEAIRLARAHGCSRIDFDQDGPLLESLPAFDW